MASSIKETLKDIFSGIPKFIEDNIDNLSLNGEEFLCEACDKPVKIDCNERNITTKNFEDHFIHGEDHKANNLNDDKLKKVLIEICGNFHPQNETPLTQIIQLNLQFLKIKSKNSYCCRVNESRLSVHFYNLPRTEHDFCCHFLSKGHEDQVKVFDDKCRNVRARLEKIYGAIPPLISYNLEFISKNGDEFFCTVCEAKLQVDSTDINLTEEQFKIHFNSGDHLKKVEQTNAYKKVPGLKEVYSNSVVPIYIIRNIDYISYSNYFNFYCSLCQESMESHGLRNNETENNLKCHFSSLNHVSRLLRKRDSQNHVYKRLRRLFETFPNIVLDNLKWLKLKGNYFYCCLCNYKIKDQKDSHYTAKNIFAHFVPGYKDVFNDNLMHEEHLEQENRRSLDVVRKLKKMFGSLPQIIEENIMHLCLVPNEPFILCNICNAKLRYYDNDPDHTLHALNHHLGSKRHQNTVSEKEINESNINKVLLEQLTSVPHFIAENIEHISYQDTSEKREYWYSRPVPEDGWDSSDDEFWNCQSEYMEKERVAGFNFYCRLCKKVIVIGRSDWYSKKSLEDDNRDLAGRLTLYNFRVHLFSEEHRDKIRVKADDVLRTTVKLQSIFGAVPNYVTSNITHIKYDYMFSCILCKINLYDKNNFRMHFLSDSYNNVESHQATLKDFEIKQNSALETLNMRFWSIPDVIMANVDFLHISGDNMFCILCQQTLYIDEYDLELTLMEFQSHMRSEKHKSILNRKWRAIEIY